MCLLAPEHPHKHVHSGKVERGKARVLLTTLRVDSRSIMSESNRPKAGFSGFSVPGSDGHGQVVTVYAHAPSFLYHQVRKIVGALKLCGEGKCCEEDVRRALDGGDPTRGLNCIAPPEGLCYMGASYDE